jgi:glycerol-3-phosphate O-acyltransferase / dihydroxyacetone phosphate acyltransferase
MLYHFIRPLVTLAFKFYFKKVYFSGNTRIPNGKPVLLSINHPTSFFEPTLMACVFQDHDFMFVTRGDVFKKPFYRRILESLNMIPIYRFRDGFSEMRQNTASLETISAALCANKKVMIFSEGTTETVKRLRPLQKGLARMAFQNWEAHGDTDLQVLPVGFTYNKPHRFRAEAYIEIGEPIALRNYYAAYQENPNRAITQLTADTAAAMRPLIVHIEKHSNDALAELLLQLYHNSFPEPVFPVFVPSNKRLMAMREIGSNLNQLPENEHVALNEKSALYFKTLSEKDISDLGIAQPEHAAWQTKVALLIGLLPFGIGWLGHYLPMKYARKTRKEKVKYLEFEGPVMAAVGLGSSIVMYFVLFLFAFIFNKIALWAFTILLPFSGFYAFVYFDLWQKYRAAIAVKRHLNTSELEDLQNQRREILKIVFR